MKRFEEPLAQMKEHARLDNFMQGAWLEGGEGCTMQTGNDAIEKFCKKWDMPLWLGYLSERIFEGISAKDSKAFPANVLEKLVALPENFDFKKLKHRLAILRLENLTVKLECIDNVIQGHKDSLEGKNVNWAELREAAELAAESAAWSAAWSAESAAWSAAESAAAELAAESGEESEEESTVWSAEELVAWSVSESAWSVAESEAWKREADNLLEFLS